MASALMTLQAYNELFPCMKNHIPLDSFCDDVDSKFSVDSRAVSAGFFLLRSDNQEKSRQIFFFRKKHEYLGMVGHLQRTAVTYFAGTAFERREVEISAADESVNSTVNRLSAEDKEVYYAVRVGHDSAILYVSPQEGSSFAEIMPEMMAKARREAREKVWEQIQRLQGGKKKDEKYIPPTYEIQPTKPWPRPKPKAKTHRGPQCAEQYGYPESNIYGPGDHRATRPLVPDDGSNGASERLPYGAPKPPM